MISELKIFFQLAVKKFLMNKTLLGLPVLSPHFFYLFSLSVLSVALGIQIILLPWLVVDQLSLSSIWVGWVQAAVLIPNLLLLLLGGVSADRGNGTRLLVPLLLINMCVHGVLAYLLFSGG